VDIHGRITNQSSTSSTTSVITIWSVFFFTMADGRIDRRPRFVRGCRVSYTGTKGTIASTCQLTGITDWTATEGPTGTEADAAPRDPPVHPSPDISTHVPASTNASPLNRPPGTLYGTSFSSSKKAVMIVRSVLQ
jgi:hypothetical protein